jgi:hypothetical protein
MLQLHRVFQKELCNGLPTVTVWRVLQKRFHLKAYKLSIAVQHLSVSNLPFSQARCTSLTCKSYSSEMFPLLDLSQFLSSVAVKTLLAAFAVPSSYTNSWTRSARRKVSAYTQYNANVNASSGIRTHNPSVWAGEDMHVSDRAAIHCDRPLRPVGTATQVLTAAPLSGQHCLWQKPLRTPLRGKQTPVVTAAWLT